MSSGAPAVAPPTPLPEHDLPRPGRRRRYLLAALATTAALLGLLFLALAVGSGEPAEGPTGLPAAGRIVEWGLPVATLAGRVAAVGTIGTLLFAAVLLPGRGAALPAQSRHALRAASTWAVAWAAATGIAALLTLSRLLGTDPTSVSWTSLRVFVEDTGAGRAALLVVALALVVAVAASRCTATGARILLLLGLSALVLPVVLSGHSSGAEDHLLAVTTLGVHVVAATVWIGGLGALLVHGRGAEALPGIASRFSSLALAAFLATAVSGVLAAWVVLGGSGAVPAALGTGYGALLVAKTAGLTVLGLLGRQHRRRTLPRLRAGDGRAFRRFAAGEVLVMLATVALAVALAASPPPGNAAPTGTASAAPAGTAAPAAADPMAGHDHGELSVGVLVDEERFHVARPVVAGSRVTVFNGSDAEVTLTAADGSFDLVVPSRTLTTFLAPQEAGEYGFTSAHSASFADVLVVE
ncbi:copper resistance D family protein [Blastococcus goldschmidtiae]|uniref:CopD family protein n=1 Tax=Blastococcus goldschmidtiae TaxID=3075546 RepID=A0ABU2KDK1_9ACTN|nr:CopD family protein [Blastococcus sp. DSM 46792]MDT0278268.1 CopD family protein [Blastococcus sp. DSM 46792]